jgi:hypothetical protein
VMPQWAAQVDQASLQIVGKLARPQSR